MMTIRIVNLIYNDLISFIVFVNLMGIYIIQLMVIIVSVLMSLSTIVGSIKGLKSRHSFALCLPAAIILAVFASQAFSDNLPIGIVLFDCVLVILNLLGVLLSVFYVNKVELYADLPQDLSSLPSFGPEVICQPKYSKLF